LHYHNTYKRGKERTSVFYVSIGHSADGVNTTISVSDVSRHRFHTATPFVFQVGGSPNKSKDKLTALYKKIVEDTVNHPKVVGFNLVRLPSDKDSFNEVIKELDKTYNWSKLIKYDLGEVTVPRVKMARNRGVVGGSFYEIVNKLEAELVKVEVDFRGRHDIYIPIKNKTVTVLGKNYRFNDSEIKSFKLLTGLDFNQVRIFAVPERFVKKVAKVKTMRSFDQAINDGINNLKATINFDDVVNKWRNRGAYASMVSSFNQYNMREMYDIVKDKIDLNSVFAKIGIMCKSNNGANSLSLIENNIIWYLRVTDFNLDGEPVITPELDNDMKMVKAFKEFYQPFLDITSTSSIRCRDDRLQFVLSVIDMIERKIATLV
jgi:hypothetical protein